MYCETVRLQLQYLCDFEEHRAKQAVASWIQAAINGNYLDIFFEQPIEELTWETAYAPEAYCNAFEAGIRGLELSKFLKAQRNQWLNKNNNFRKCRLIEDVLFGSKLEHFDFVFLMDHAEEIVSNLPERWREWECSSG